MIVLGIESSCDETAAAVLADGRRILSSVVASQDAIHAPYGGVVPELASRRHLEVIVPVVEKALADADVRLPDLDGIAVTRAFPRLTTMRRPSWPRRLVSRRGGRVVECAALEMRFTGNRDVGSNPTLSASQKSNKINRL